MVQFEPGLESSQIAPKKCGSIRAGISLSAVGGKVLSHLS